MHEAVGVQNESQAFQLANAAIEAALVNIQHKGYIAENYPMAGSLAGGSWEVSVTPAMDSEYVARATGTAHSGATESIEVESST